MEDLKWKPRKWPQETSEMQTWQWNYGTLTLHKVQRNDGTVTMEDLKWKPNLAVELWNLDTAQGAVQQWTGTMEDLKWKPRSGGREPLKCKPGSGTMEP